MSYFTTTPKLTMIVRDLSLVPYASVFLSEGMQSNQFRVTCSVKVIDIYGAFTISSALVSAFALDEFDISKVSKLLTVGQAYSDTNIINQVISAATQKLNAVNCSLSPNCTALSRQSCSLVTNTCGDCLPGFIGYQGSANSPCVVTDIPLLHNETKFLEDNSAVFQLKSLTTCSENTCILGKCVNSVCVQYPKVCPNNCSSPSGICIFEDANGLPLTSCSANDPFCKARCQCFPNRHGSDCSLTQLEFWEKRELRSLICATLSQAVVSQTIDSDALLFFVNLIALNIQDGSQLSNSALSLCLSTYNELVQLNAQIMSAGASDAISSTLSNFMNIRNMSLSISDTIDLVSLEIASFWRKSLTPGETSTVFSTENFRIVSMMWSPGMSSTVTLQSNFGLLTGLSPTTVFVDTGNYNGSSNGDFNFIGITVIEFFSNFVDRKVNSSIIQLQVFYFNEIPMELKSTFNSINQAPIDYPYFPVEARGMQCDLSDTPYNLSTICSIAPYVLDHYDKAYPESELTANSSFQCPGTLRGSVTYYCPGFKYSPFCFTSNLSRSFASVIDCQVLEFSDTETLVQSLTIPNRLSVVEVSLSKGLYVLTHSTSLVTFETENPSVPRRANQVLINSISILTAVVVLFLLRRKYAMNRNKNKPQKITHGSKGTDDENSSSIENAVVDLYKELDELFTKLIPDEFDLTNLFYHLQPFTILKKRNRQQSDNASRSIYYFLIYLFCEALNHILVVELLLVTYQSDTGECEALRDERICLAALSADFVSHGCVWERVGQTCAFRIPTYEWTHIIRFIAFISVATRPLNFFLVYILQFLDTIDLACQEDELVFGTRKGTSHNKIYVLDSSSNIDENGNSPEFRKEVGYVSSKDSLRQQLVEEAERIRVEKEPVKKSKIQNVFTKLLTKQAKYFLAARLSLLQKHSDLLVPSDEADYLMMLENSEKVSSMWPFAPAPYFDRSWQLSGIIEHQIVTFLLQFGQYGQPSVSSVIVRSLDKHMIEHTLARARREEGLISDVLGTIISEEHQDVFLLQMFILYSIGRVNFNIAKTAIENSNNHNIFRGKYQFLISKTFADSILGLYILSLIVIIAVFGRFIGSRVLIYGITAFASSFVFDGFILKPISIIFLKCFYNLFLGIEYLNTLLVLKAKVPKILSRKYGSLATKDALLQHFNPACRAARKFPHLGSSRLLLSIHDFDIPEWKVRIKKTDDWYCYMFPSEILFFFSHFLSVFPADLQYLVYESVIVFCTNLFMFSIYNFLSASIPIQIVVSVIVGSILLMYIFQFFILRGRQKKLEIEVRKEIIDDKRRKRRRDKINLPNISVDEDDDNNPLENTKITDTIDLNTPLQLYKSDDQEPVLTFDSIEHQSPRLTEQKEVHKPFTFPPSKSDICAARLLHRFDSLESEEVNGGKFPEKKNRFKLRMETASESDFRHFVNGKYTGLDISIRQIAGPPRGGLLVKNVSFHREDNAIGSTSESKPYFFEGTTSYMSKSRSIETMKPKYSYDKRSVVQELSSRNVVTLNSTPARNRGHRRSHSSESFERVGPGVLHRQLAMATLSDKPTRQVLIPEERIYDDFDLFSEVREERFGTDYRKSSIFESNNEEVHGPGKARSLDDHDLSTIAYKKRKTRRNFAFHNEAK